MSVTRIMKRRFWQKREVGRVKAIHPQTKKEIWVNPQRDAIISNDLGAELRRLPGTLSWYLSLRATARTALKEAQHEEHNMSEDLYVEKRAEKGAAKVTETELKIAVKADSRMRKAFRKRMEAEAMVRHMEDAVEQISTKRWTLSDLVKWQLQERGVKDHA